MNSSDTTAKTTHDLWIESRQFQIAMSRPTPTTIELKVTRPIGLTTVDGAVLLLNKKPISGTNYPLDGTTYTGSTDESVIADSIVGPDGAHVISFWSGILAKPFPESVDNLSTQTTSFIVTISNTLPNQLYYASIHGASNVLQYYPVGVQSYPLEGSRVEKGVAAFAGSIPTLPEAPLSPTTGMVYHDQQLNLIQYWTGEIWIPTRADTILTGTVNPGIQGQVYLLGGGILKIFNGIKWIQGTSSNLQFRTQTGWIPLSNVSGRIDLPKEPESGDFIWNYTTSRAQYWDGDAWQTPSAASTLLNLGSTLVPAFISPMTIEGLDLIDPFLGQLFYNSVTKDLNAWDGTTWRLANTAQAGTPTSDKISIGNDGSYDERIRLIKVLKNQLGWPQSCVELKEEQFNIAIDNALDNYRQWCDGAYRLQYVMFQLVANQQTYYLNNPTDKTDRIVDVGKIHRLNILGIETANGNDAVWSSGILTSYYSAVQVDILSLHLLSSMSEEFQRLFAGDLTFLWDEPSRELLVTRKIYRNEKVIIECNMERSEQELLVDRWCKQFMQNYALAECKMMLGMIRSKFTSGTPGAAGTITLNGEMLISEARQDMAELKQSCLDYEYGGHVNGGNQSFLFS